MYKYFTPLTFMLFFCFSADVSSSARPAKPSLIVIQGGPGMASSYLSPYFLPLKRFYRLYYLDRMPLRQTPVSTHSITMLVKKIEALRQFLGVKKISIIAHSFGCMPALKYLLSHSKKVQKIVFISSFAKRHPNQYDAFYKALKKADPAADFTLFKTSLYFYKKKYKSEAFIKKFLASYSFNSRMFDEITSSSEFVHFDIRKKVKKLNTPPSLILCGEHDIITPPFLSYELAGVLKSSKLVILKRCGHYPFIEENTNFIAQVKRFLSSN